MKNLLELIAEFRDWQKQWDNAVVTFPSDVEQFMQTLSQKYSVTKINAGLTFGQAIEAIKEGKKVCRQGWNGKGMYLTLVQGYPVNGHLNSAAVDSEVEGQTQGKAGQMLPHIVMKTAGDSHYWGAGYSDYVPWLASQTDILAEDWVLLD